MRQPKSMRIYVTALVLGMVTLAVPTQAQRSEQKSAPATKVREKPDALKTLVEHDTAWKQKAELEIEMLQAQIDAKRAEIKRRETEQRIAELAPTLAILAKLDEPITMAFPDETPLEDVLKYIKSATTGSNDNGIPIYVDPAGLQKAEKTMSSPIMLDLDGVPLKTTLKLLLKQLGLTYTVKDGFMTITAED